MTAKKTFEVLATNGDTHLGGEDFDSRLINYLVEEFKKDQGIDLRNDPLAMQRLKEAQKKRKSNCLPLSRPTLTCRTSLQMRPVRNT
ncbi:chaperone protein DnaK (Heat shock protein 70) (Heat shock 70 kDaprotein) (HSP70) [Escherichia coli]|nr:chaperone protein DnaK (Heat shock protein 70) (Heat shock 70 kDaprotein) (HSP70) [Escherichia coli]